MKCTALSSKDAVSWSDWGYYHDSSSLPLRMTSKDPVPLIPSSRFATTSCVASKEPANSTNAPSLSSLVLLPSKKSFSDYPSLSQSESLALPSTGSLKPPLGPTIIKKIGPTIIKKIGLNAPKHSGQSRCMRCDSDAF